MPQHHRRSLGIAALLILSVTTALCHEIPADFALHARFYPGAGEYGSGPNPWRLAIRSDGTGTQEATTLGANTPTGVRMVAKRVVVSARGLKRLQAAIERADFFTLPGDLSTSEFAHVAGVRLKITMGGRTREVHFIVPNDTYDSAALTRFWPVWRAVLKEVPSPNKNEELLHWIRHVRPDLTMRSNQAMEGTAGSLGSSPSMKSHPQPAATRHPTSGR